jgi:hypothetical protein
MPWLDKIYSARRRLLEGHANVRRGLPSNPAFSERATGIERKVEFGGKARGAGKMQASTTIGQIAHDTIERHTTSRNDFGALEYFGPRKPPMLEHTQRPNLQFDENNCRLKLFQDWKCYCLNSPNVWKP